MNQSRNPASGDKNPPGAALWAAGAAVRIGGFSLVSEEEEQIQRETHFCFGVTENPGLVEVDGEAPFATGPDTVRLHRPGDLLRSQSPARHRAGCWIAFNDFAHDDELAHAFDRPFLRPSLPALARLRAVFAAARFGDRDTLWADEAALDALDGIVRQGATDDRLRLRGAGRYALVRDADALIAERYATDMPLSAIARTLGVSSSYLARTYRAVAGLTTHARRERLRIAEALRRLADGEPNLSALAFDLGYSSHSHFSAAFRRVVGAAPREARDAMNTAAVRNFDSAAGERDA